MSIRTNIYSILALALALLPSVAFGVTAPEDFAGFVALLINLIQILIYVVFGLTFLVFLWGIIKRWIVHGGDARSVEEGRTFVLAGLVGLIVMVSLWGIVYIIKISLLGV